MSSSDSANLALGILGVLTIIPFIFGLMKDRLPYARLRYFDELVAEIDSFLLSLEEQGIFRQASSAIHFRKCLAKVRREADRPRMETYRASSIWQQLKGLFNGLSKKLSELSSSALALRAEISTTATEDLAQAESVSTLQSNDTHEGLADPIPERPCLPAPNSDSNYGSEFDGVSFIEAITIPSPPGASQKPEGLPTVLGPHIPHLGDTSIVVHNARKRQQSEQYVRRSKRYLAARHLSMPSVAQMEYRKSGVMHSDDFKRALRTCTYDSVLSGSTCVSESDSLPVHVKSTRDQDHRHSGLRRVLGSFRNRSRDGASDTRSSYRVACWIRGLVPTAWTTD